jgi:glycolate oxidase FAD binding subunit
MLDFGMPPARAGLALDMRGLDRVVDYPARDMTITVQAGMSIAALSTVLAGEKQRVPIDVPRPSVATVGGAIATNTCGPSRYGFGTWRDYVIGIRFVNDRGEECGAGGRVVKNVAGYDLCKLYAGSLGTLGVLTQVTLKVRPLPEERAIVLLDCECHQLPALLDALSASRTQPVCLDVLNRSASRRLAGALLPRTADAPWLLVVGFEGNRDAVGWQLQQLIRELPDAGARRLDAQVGAAAERVLRALVELASVPDARLAFKINLLPSATAAFCHAALDMSGEGLLQAHAGNGIVLGHVLDALTLDEARTMLQKLGDLAAAGQGNAVVLRCPTDWKRSLPTWVRAPGDVWLMERVKVALDPHDRFNPGRFLASLR